MSTASSSRKQAHLSQRDSELLLSYLTVPYLRMPLVLTFFASNDRIHKLGSTKLRRILDSVLFEPQRCLQMDATAISPAPENRAYRLSAPISRQSAKNPLNWSSPSGVCAGGAPAERLRGRRNGCMTA